MQIQTTKSNGLAAWDQAWRELYAIKRTHHVFLLHGNTGDYVTGTTDLRTHLAASLAKKAVVLVYNRAEGIRFLAPTPEGEAAMKRAFLELLGMAATVDEDDAAAYAEMGGPATDEELPRDPDKALPLIDRVLRMPVMASEVNGQKVLTPSIAVILDYVGSIVPNGQAGELSPEDRTTLILLQRWAQDPGIIKNGHPIFLVTSVLGDVNSQLYAASSRIACIELPMPNHHERLAFIEGLMAANAERCAFDVTAGEFARLTAGLGRVHVTEIVKSGIGAGVPVTAELIRERKRRIISDEFGGVIELMDNPVSFADVGGLEAIKEFARWAVIEPMTTGENLGLVPMGVLFAGPAGTGKTLLAQAIANESGLNAIQLRMSKIMAGIVGESERNLERVITCCQAMAPVLVFADELDQTVQRSNASLDSGVNMRLFQRLLEWLGDGTHRGEILFIGASNRPKAIDPALKRPGRIDNILVFPAPEQDDREAIARVMIRKYLSPYGGDEPFFAIGESNRAARVVAEATDGWTGAEIEKLARKANELLLRKRAAGMEEAFRQALDRVLPRTAAILEMTYEALGEIDDVDLVPAKYHAYVRDRKALKAAVKEVREEMGATESEEGARGL